MESPWACLTNVDCLSHPPPYPGYHLLWAGVENDGSTPVPRVSGLDEEQARHIVQ